MLIQWTKLLFLFSLCLTLGICDDLKSIAGRNILNYLNSNSEQIYRYKIIKTLDISEKSDDGIYEFKTEIEVECLQDVDSPCFTKFFSCDGKFQHKTETNEFEIILAFCNPEEAVTLESEDELIDPTTEKNTSTAKKDENLDESSISTTKSNKEENEITNVGISKDIKEDVKICTGCLTDLQLNVTGLPILLNTALQHIQSERDNIHRVLEVVRVQRQVVSGIKYVLTIIVVPTNCSKDTNDGSDDKCPKLLTSPYEYCQVEYWEKPWISGNKDIISNNCTISQHFNATKEDNEDILHTRILGDTASDELSPTRLMYMESQIIPDKTTEKHNSGLSNIDKQFLDDFFGNTESNVNINNEILKVQPSKKDQSREIGSKEPKLSLLEIKNDVSMISVIDQRERLSRSLKQDTSEETSEQSTDNPNSSESNDTSEEKKKKTKKLVKRDTSEETDESNSTSEEKERIKTETLKKIVKRDISETSEESTENPNTSESNDTSEEHKKSKKVKRAVPYDTNTSESKSSDEDNKLHRRKRGTRDSRAQSSLETTNDTQDISLDTLIKNYDESISSLSTEEDSITRHKRKAKDDSSSSSSSSSSSDDDDDNNNGNDNKIHSKLSGTDNCKNGDNDDDSSSSSSSSDDDDDDNNNGNDCKKNKRSKSKRSSDLTEKQAKNIIRNLAEIAVDSLDDIDKDNLRRVVLNIENVQKTQLEGIIYQLTLKTALSNCEEIKRTSSEINLLKHYDRDENCIKDIKTNSIKTCKVQIHVNEDLTSQKVLKSECSSKQKRSSQALVGAPSDLPNNDENIVKLVDSTLVLLDGSTEHANKYKVVEITSANQQVVSGMKYTISARIQLSDCLKSDNKDAKKCGALQGSQVENCKIVIWDQPWLPQGRKTTITCGQKQPQQFRSKRSLVGGVETLSPDDETILNLLEHTLTHLDKKSVLETKYKPTEIVSATYQLVAGRLYTIKVRIAPSDCPKTDTKTRDECGLAKEVTPALCEIKIWDRPWLKDGKETNVTCNDEFVHSFRSKRSTIRLLGKENIEAQLNYFHDFKNRFNKVYNSELEERQRFRIFRKNLLKIEDLNNYDKGTATYGITKFADLTDEEFRRFHKGLRTDLRHENEIPFVDAEIPEVDVPTEFDWRKKGVVTEVKDQAQCGSCWAFSVTGNVEGQYAIKHNNLLSLSEQELVDCDKTDDGCSGGLMDNAYRAIEQLGGLETEKDYPYDAEDERCHFNKTLAKVQLSGAVNISQNENDMAKWLTQNGPIAIAINANAMQFYVGGVSHPFKFLCDPNNLDHGVLIVGYGVHTYKLFNKTLPYWIVKNSWGKSWGEQGYYRVYRGDGTCGLNQTPSSAIVV